MTSLFSIDQWNEIAKRGTSGDQVYDILASWKSDHNKLQSTISTQADEIKKWKEDAERLAKQCDEAGNVIATVVGCCTYSSEEKAKTGAYGISHEAFTKIDGYIRNYELPTDSPITKHTALMKKLESEGKNEPT